VKDAVIVGGSGYVGGELLRLLLRHPEIRVVQVTSDSMAGRPVTRAHPNLRRATDLTFAPLAERRSADLTFLATPHGESMALVPPVLDAGGIAVDLSADFRLKDPAQYPEYYGRPHPRPDLLADAVYGLPELHREALRTARLIAVPGCIATAATLALAPLLRAGLGANRPVVVDAKSGSSASGRDAGPAGSHSERSNVMRAYAPAGHRHTAEIEQETGATIALSCHSVEPVRGVLATCHVSTEAPVPTKDLWRIYRAAYGAEPFVRVVHESDGWYREPEPRLLTGTNYCDVGFAADDHVPRVVALGAIDNLGKGAAGNAIQSVNVRFGWPEATALDFLGLHPL
jgi:LysW-gamma-L-alpha-aminoadipyl-6-phosphate/LysW-L-glutamyl-5-phosphate reductase